MADIIKKVPLASIEEIANIKDESFVVITQDGESYRIALDKLFDKYLKEKDLHLVAANITAGRLILEMSNGETIDAGKVSETKEYGVCYNRKTKSPTLTRCGAALGKTAAYGVGEKEAVNDFDNIYPWSEIKVCTLKDDGTVTSYKGDANFATDGSIGQVMVEFPKFYYKRIIDETNDLEYIYVSEDKLTGYDVYPAFINAAGEEIEKIYIAAYKMVNDPDDGAKGSSIVSDSSAITYNFSGVNSSANRGEDENHNWHNLTYDEYVMIEILFMIEFATLNSESIFKSYRTNEDFCAGMDVPDAASASTNTICTKQLYTTDDDGNDALLVYVGQEVEMFFDILQGGDYTPSDTDTLEEPGTLDDGTKYQMCISKRRVTAVEDNGTYVSVTFDGKPIPLMTSDDSINSSDDYTGITEYIKAPSGVLGESPLTIVPFRYRYLENLFSSGYTWLNGIVIGEDGTYVTNDVTKMAIKESTYRMNKTGYAKLSYDIKHTIGYISLMGYDKDNPWALVPEDTGGTSDSGYCDKLEGAINNTATYDYVFRIGTNSAGSGGLFSLSSSNASTANLHRSKYFGRLAYRHYQ